ncbi:hypothetical protein [Nonomuraea sp. NPDC049784]|uniref:hypothetical protein n=1 Tax=Nonomuraea sp. NPDC049784 TaxID=3154361 RepID=UPI0033F12D96
MYEWRPYVQPAFTRRDVAETSCCEEFVLCHMGATYFALRATGPGRFEETGRGEYAHAFSVWIDLSARHDHKPKASARPNHQEGAVS